MLPFLNVENTNINQNLDVSGALRYKPSNGLSTWQAILNKIYCLLFLITLPTILLKEADNNVGIIVCFAVSGLEWTCTSQLAFLNK